MGPNKDLNPLSGIQLMSKMKMPDAIRFFFQRYWHAFLFFGYPLLMWYFALLEKYIVPEYWVSCSIDQQIPFWPAFIIPYVLWFPLVAVVLIALCFSDRGDFGRALMLLFTGMLTAMLIYTVFPHGQPLRPIVTGDDFFSRAVRYSIYSVDTNTNCFPSIHVLNQLAIHIGLCKSKLFGRSRMWKNASFVMTVLVCASTVFIKQHSILDVAAALLIEAPLYLLVFKMSWWQYLPVTMRRFLINKAGRLNLQGDFECFAVSEETVQTVRED